MATGCAICSTGESPWKTRLGQDFDVRSYVFDSHLRAVDGFDALDVRRDGHCADDVARGALQTVPRSAACRRARSSPTATGPTWAISIGRSSPPIYPVVPPSRVAARDVGVSELSISQTNFESAPVVVRADVSAVGFRGEPIVALIADEAGKKVERQDADSNRRRQAAELPVSVPARRKASASIASRRFLSRKRRKVSEVRRRRASTEQTLANNSRLVVVDQGGGPYRVLYVSGRPNWEFKFLRRAIEEDKEVELIGWMRIARPPAEIRLS